MKADGFAVGGYKNYLCCYPGKSIYAADGC